MRAELDNQILKYDINNIEYQRFFYIFIETLNKHDLKKKTSSQISKSREIYDEKRAQGKL